MYKRCVTSRLLPHEPPHGKKTVGGASDNASGDDTGDKIDGSELLVVSHVKQQLCSKMESSLSSSLSSGHPPRLSRASPLPAMSQAI
jgi:hypothetical protein